MSDALQRVYDEHMRVVNRPPRPGSIPLEGADRTGAPVISELARAETQQRLSWLPRRRPWRELEAFERDLADLRRQHGEATERVRGLLEAVAAEPQRDADAVAQW